MRRLRRLGPCALLLAVAGCVPGSSPAFDNDPLFNGPRIPPNGAAAQRPAAPATGTVQLPPSDGTTSPAALAAAVPAADASSLRIGATPAALASAPHDSGDPWQPAPTGAALQPPQPLVGPPPRPINDADLAPPTAPVPAPPPIVSPTAGAPTGSDQYEQLQDELARRGVLFQSLEGPDDHGVWSFTCGVPKHGDPNSIHRVEVSAVGDRGLPAMRAAVEQIDREAP